MMNTGTLTLVVTLVCAAASLAGGPARAREPKAPAPMDALKGFAGHGSCTGKVMPGDENPGHASTGGYHGEKVLDGHWIVFHYDEDRTAANPKPFHVVQDMSYDETTKRYVAVLFDNTESVYGSGSSAGWEGDTFTLDTVPSSNPGNIAFRDVFTRDKAGVVTRHQGMMRDASGKWVETDEESCKKTS